MKNELSIKGYAVIGIIFTLVTVVSFAIPTDKTITFWISYIFAVAAIMVQIPLWQHSFRGQSNINSKFLGIPLVNVGVIYLVLQLIVSLVFKVFPYIPSWICIIVCAGLGGITGICLIGVNVGIEEIVRVEEKIKKKVFYIKELQVEVELLVENETDQEVRKCLKKLVEKIGYSDPMSETGLEKIEADIRDKICELKDSNKRIELIDEIVLLLEERNKKVKILK